MFVLTYTRIFINCTGYNSLLENLLTEQQFVDIINQLSGASVFEIVAKLQNGMELFFSTELQVLPWKIVLSSENKWFQMLKKLFK